MYELPFWFLFLSLFMPRLCLFVEWWQDATFPFIQPFTGASWLLLPRLLILVMIYTDLGFGKWFIAHLIAAVLVYLSGFIALD